MSCCNISASGGSCSCVKGERACSPCKPYSSRAHELLKQDRDPAVQVLIPPATTGVLLPPSRGSAVYNYSCADYLLKNLDPATVGNAFLSGIRWVTITDPLGAAARQEGLTSRTIEQFICGDSCQYFSIDATAIGGSTLEILTLEVDNTHAANQATVELEIRGRALCVPVYEPMPEDY